MDQPTVSFTIGQEELQLILKVLKVSTFPGLSIPANDQSEEVNAAVLLAAGRGLLARGLATVDTEGKISLNPVLCTTIGRCAALQQMSTIIHWQHQQKPIIQYHYRHSDYTVVYRPHPVGMHQFRLSTDIDMGGDAVRDGLADVPQASPSGPVVTLPRTTLTEIKKLPSEQSDVAVTHLVTAGMPPLHAPQLVQAMLNAALIVTFQLLYRVQPDPPQQMVTVLADDATCWILQAQHAQAPHVSVQCVTPAEVQRMVETTFARFAETPLDQPRDEEPSLQTPMSPSKMSAKSAYKGSG